MARLSYIVIITGIALMCVLAEELYSDKYDDIDAESILQNDNLRDQYYGCYMGVTPCPTEDAKFFAGIWSEALQTKCKRCTKKQKDIVNLVLKWYKENRPDEYEAMLGKSVEDMINMNC